MLKNQTADSYQPRTEKRDSKLQPQWSAFEQEAMPHLNALRGFASYCSANKEDAEDLVQETLITAMRCFHQYTPGTNCRAWLFCIARNISHHVRRKNKRRILECETDEFFFAGQQVEYDFLQDQIDGQTLELLKIIPKNYRRAVRLADIENYKYAEIAETLDLPIGTVMSRLHRGRRILRNYLEENPAKNFRAGN